MEQKHEILLSALAHARRAEPLPAMPEVTEHQWQVVFRLAEEHKILPLIFEAAYQQPGLQAGNLVPRYRGTVMRAVFAQTSKTMEFLELYGRLRQAGVTPLVVKGIICRQLYPMPDHRPSSDEDVLIPPEQFPLLIGFCLISVCRPRSRRKTLKKAMRSPIAKPAVRSISSCTSISSRRNPGLTAI